MAFCRVSYHTFHSGVNKNNEYFDGNILSFRELMSIIRSQGRIFVAALPQESVTANIARRVLKIIREEYDALHAVYAAIYF